MTDAESIQLFAQLNARALRGIAQQGSTYNAPEGAPFQMHNMPQQQRMPQQQIPDFQVPQIPDFLPSDVPTNLVALPRDEKGNPIVPAEYRHLVSNQPPVPTENNLTNYSNATFAIPNYANTSNEVGESKFDLIMKELKSLKKAINKLIKQNETAKLQIPQPSTIVVNDTETQSD